MKETVEDAQKRAVLLKSDERFIHCVPLTDENMDLYLKRMVMQHILTDEEVQHRDFFDQAKKCYDFYTKALFG